MKFPEKLEPFNNGNLVEYREITKGGFLNEEPEEYQIHDKVLHHIALVDNVEMAQLITNCINKVYKDEKIVENNGKRMGEFINKFSEKGTIDRNK